MAAIRESNLQGTETISSSSPPTEPVSVETTAAGKLIDHLKFTADSAIINATNRADWLALAANAGQNVSEKSIAKRELVQPDPLRRDQTIGAGWALPAPTALTLPPIPEELKVNFDKIATDAAKDLNDLKNSWMAQFLPMVTDVSRLDALYALILSGGDDAAIAGRLATLENDLSQALQSITSSALGALNVSITTVNKNLADNFAAANTGVASALAAASDNTQEIAWTRGRDQGAREAARLEKQATDTYAARGFSLPIGTLTAAAARQRGASLSAASDLAAQQAEKVQQMFIDVAKATVEAYLRNMDAQSNAGITAYRTVVETTLRYSELSLDANKSKVAQALSHLQLRLDFTKFSGDLAVKYRLGVIGGINDLIRAYAALRDSEIQYIANISEANQRAYAAITDYFRAALSQADMGLRVDITNNDTDVKWAGVAADFIGRAVTNYVNAASAAADVFARTAGMALSGLNGIASVASSG